MRPIGALTRRIGAAKNMLLGHHKAPFPNTLTDKVFDNLPSVTLTHDKELMLCLTRRLHHSRTVKIEREHRTHILLLRTVAATWLSRMTAVRVSGPKMPKPK